MMVTVGNCWPKGCRFTCLGGSSGVGSSTNLSPPLARTRCQRKESLSYQEPLDFDGRNDCKLTSRYYISIASFIPKDNTWLYKWCLGSIFRKITHILEGGPGLLLVSYECVPNALLFFNTRNGYAVPCPELNKLVYVLHKDIAWSACSLESRSTVKRKKMGLSWHLHSLTSASPTSEV